LQRIKIINLKIIKIKIMFGLNKTTKKFLDLRGKIAIVTGARRGMGRTHALTLAQAGAKVVVSDISLEDCQKVVEEIKKDKGEAVAIKCDISSKADVDNLVKATLKAFGKIDILVNNAGIFPFQPFLEMKEQDFEKVINVNLKGYFLMSQACAREMQKNQPDGKGQRGSIINISSIAAMMGFAGLSHYCASKGGICAMTRALALELAPIGIRINDINPGAIDTPGVANANITEEQRKAMLAPIPLKRQGRDHEISNAVLFLASEESSYMTGSVMVVDGGWTA
jgi:NAD(P)-dependent dehydrogenase (short-subunit alcohol dehydrogenase family)